MLDADAEQSSSHISRKEDDMSDFGLPNNVRIAVIGVQAPQRLNRPLSSFPKSFISARNPPHSCYFMEFKFNAEVAEDLLSKIFCGNVTCVRDETQLKALIVVSHAERHFLYDLFETVTATGSVEYAKVVRIIAQANLVQGIDV